jgi:hypothetical protein
MYKPSGIVRPIGLAIVLAIGFGTVFALVVVWGASIWESLHATSGSYENLIVRADGTPLIQRTTYDRYQQIVTLHALDGSQVAPRDMASADSLTGAALGTGRQNIHFPLEGNARIEEFNDRQSPPNFWYFIHDGARDGRGYFVGYNSRNKLCVGFIGRNGSCSEEPPVEQWFPMDGFKMASRAGFSRSIRSDSWNGSDHVLDFSPYKIAMISGNQLIEVDLQERSVRPLLKSANVMSMGMLTTPPISKAGEEKRHADLREKRAVRTADQVFVLDASEKLSSTYVIPEALRDEDFTIYELSGRSALVTVSRRLPDGRQREELSWIDASGKVLRQGGVSLDGGSSHSDAREAWQAIAVVPSPLALALMVMLGPISDHLRNGLAPSYATALLQVLSAAWPAMLVIALLSAALAWYCYRRNRRYYQAASAAWFVFIFLAGVPGLVGYLFHRRWPVLEKCPACGQGVPRDREACAKCGAAFPVPQPKGCEIFA